MIDADELAALLRRTAGVDEFVVTELRRVRARRVLGPHASHSLDDQRELSCVLYRDQRQGRGARQLSLAELDRDGARAALRQAAADAARSHGPPWRLPPPAAPAIVAVADDALADPAGAADELVGRLAAALPRRARVLEAAVEVESTTTTVRSSTGFASAFTGTRARWRAALEAGGDAPAAGEGAARRLADLSLAAELASLADRAGRRAAPVEPGRYDLVLRLGAIAPLSPNWAWFAPIARQAGGALLRRGLTRYRSGQSIHPEPVRGDLLDVASDGTLPYGLLSAPFGPCGEPVRRFDLVRAGRAAGVALDLREAGLRQTTANGGVRNLDVGAGVHGADALLAPGERPLLVVDDLAWLEIDARGDASAGLGAAELVGAGFRRGGALAEDVFRLWARAKLGSERARRGWYRGPALVRFDDVRLL